MRRRLGILGPVALAAIAALAAAPLAPPAVADHEVLHERPQREAVARFPSGFPALADSEWSFALGGFGGPLDDDSAWGVEPAGPFADRDPVIFVHGNVVDHGDWYPVRDDFIAAGWDPDDLWAVSYNGLGNNSGSGARANPRRDAEHASGDGLPRNTANEINAGDVAAFIDAVLAHTGAARFSVVGHSLGVTVARRALELQPDLADRLVAFVGIAGGNHGTSLCPPGSAGALHSCDELEAGSAWLDALNAAPDEFGSAEVMTVYDGTGTSDVAFLGPHYASSPRLGDVIPEALDCTYPFRGHNDLRLSAGIVEGYRLFIEAADAGNPLPVCPPDPLGMR